MPLHIHELKVDQTVLPLGQHYLLVSNINIPSHYLSTTFNQVLDRIHRFIVLEYINIQNVQFQVCATYQLRNRVNGAIKTWTGSFHPRGNQLNALNQFETFSPTFKTKVQEACSDENIYEKLNLFHVDTDWVFEQLVSIYISVQGVAPAHHPSILQKNLAVRYNNGKTERKQVSFLLP